MTDIVAKVEFPKYVGVRCLMMPYIQGDPQSVPRIYQRYAGILGSVFVRKGDIGYLTIDESIAIKGKPHRGTRAKSARALHTEAGKSADRRVPQWGGGIWGGSARVTLDRGVRVLLASNLDGSCAVWNAEHDNTSEDGDIGHESRLYPYETARVLKAGEVCDIGIFTPHESLPVPYTARRQFLRIVSSGVHGREPYFTENPMLRV